MSPDAITPKPWKMPSLFRPGGAIFAKELRVSSRRKRYYWLRFAYLILLTFFVALIWIKESRSFSSGGVFSISRMAEAGKSVTIVILVFQFVAILLVAIVQLSPSISGEVRAKTLGALMSTPLTSSQIVLGKLLSGMWNLLILLALSLPLLAIVRVFGGVPWGLVVAGICITLTAAVLVAAIAILVSIFCRQTYAAILATMGVLFVLFALIPLLMFLILNALDAYSLMRDLEKGLRYVHPAVAIADIVERLAYVGRGWLGGSTFVWPVHCAVMLVASGVVLAFCVLLVRRVTFRRAMGGGASSPRRTARRMGTAAAPPAAGRPIRRIKGSPVIWKELHRPLFKSRKWRWIITGVVLGVIGLIYALLAADNDLDDMDTQMVFAVVFLIVGVLVTAVLSATTISAERESRTLPLLLCCDLHEAHIIAGKGLGVARRTLPIWALMFAHLTLFCLFGALAPIALFHMALIVAGAVVFLIGSGLYFSTVCRKTTSAVVANLATAITLWGILLLVLVVFHETTRFARDGIEVAVDGSPFVQAVVVIEGGVRRMRHNGRYYRHDAYNWPHGWANALDTTFFIFVSMVVHVLAGGAMARQAAARLRAGPGRRGRKVRRVMAK